MSLNIISKFHLTFTKVILVISIIILISCITYTTATKASENNWIINPITVDSRELHEAPSIAVDENNIHVVWNHWPLYNLSGIYYAKSTDNGKNFNTAILLSPNATTAINPVIAVNKPYIHVVWKDYRHENPEIYYKKSTDNGETWSQSTRITYNSTRKSNIKNNIYDISISVEHNNIYLAWKDYRSESSEIFFKRSIDNGETWEKYQRLSHGYAPAYNPFIAVQNKNIYVSWEEWGSRSNICFTKSSDQGKNWTEKIYLTDTNSGDSEKPYLTTWESTIYISWQDTRTGSSHLYFKKSTDEGNTWTDTTQITNDTYIYFNPRIIVSNQKLFLISQCRENNNIDISYQTSINNGKNWTTPVRLTEEETNAYDTALANAADNIHIVWQKYYEAGWAQIWHMTNSEGKPVISSISLSQTKTSSPSIIEIQVDGFDPKYNKSELECTLEYKTQRDIWFEIPVYLNNNIWTGALEITNNSLNGNYEIKSQLTNPSGISSEWSEIQNLQVSITDTYSNNFEFIFIALISIIIISILVLVIKCMIKVKKNENKK